MSRDIAEIPGLNRERRRNFNYSGQYAGHSVSSPNGNNPNVLVGAGNFVVTNTVIRAGALSAVGGQQKIRIRERGRNNDRRPRSTHPNSFGAGDYPSVLPRFEGSISGTTFGTASFSAVGGNRNLYSSPSDNDASTSHMTVLPDLNGGGFPRPVDGHFEDGSYSAVARNMYPSRDGPSVLRDFRHFGVNNARLLPGVLSAVGGDQTVEYGDGDGIDVSVEAD